MSASVQPLMNKQEPVRQAVYWVTGLSGAGKTTLAVGLVDKLRSDGHQVVHIDGDTVRSMLGNDLGYDLKDRIANAYRISRLCQFLQQQGTLVVCSTMSLYPEIWEWNAKHLDPYHLVYVKVSHEVLRSRDQKGLYSGVENGTSCDVVGMDLPFHEPPSPNLILENNNPVHRLMNIEKLYALVSENNYEAR
jgi:adenylylsulfate kinase-like enzyme